MNTGVQGRGVYPQAGGTAMGGPSGSDNDGSFTPPYSADVHTHTNVDEYSKDDHSIDVKDNDVYPPPAAPIPYGVAMAPGMGPFTEDKKKRDYPAGGTALGGPSGDDGGQTFNMPITGNFHTDVSESDEDDHSIKIKNKHVHPPPFAHPPNVLVPPGPVIGEIGPGFRNGAPGETHKDHFHVPAEAFGKRWGPEVGGTAMGGPGSGSPPVEFDGHVAAGGTAMGGPSGEDEGIEWEGGAEADLHSNVNEYSHDDHSIDLKHTDIYPPPPVEFGPPPFGPPFKRHWEPQTGGTAMGGPSGDDEGQTFNMPITVDTNTGIHEYSHDDHSIDLEHHDVYPPPVPPFGAAGAFVPEGAPLRRAYSPSANERVPGGTAMGGPSGDDDGINFGAPNSVEVDSNVHEHHEDNHAIKAESTDVHAVPHMPWLPYHAKPVVEHEHPACAPEVHEVLHTVTKTQTEVVHPTATVTETPAEHVVESIKTIHDTMTVTKTAPAHVVQATETVYETPKEHVVEVTDTVTKTPHAHVAHATETHVAHAIKTVYETPTAHVVETSSIPMSAIPMQTPESKVLYSSMATQFASVPSYKYKSQRPQSSSGAYSMIPVQVPAAHSASSSMKLAMPSGADPMHSQMASASASPSHGTMFTGEASRLSGGIVSAAAAVMGVLAFVL